MGSAMLSPIPGADLARLRNGLLLVAMQRLGSEDLAQDAAQETIARVLVALDQARVDAEQLVPYAYGVLRHVLVDMQRQAGREVPLPPTLEIASGWRSPLERLVSLETGTRVRQALKRLSPAERVLLDRCFVQGKRVSEIARETAEPPGRLRQRKLRALTRLRAMLRNETSAAPTD
jgi:RNA polymerase sigma-70 factor (ECF subfamily)